MAFFTRNREQRLVDELLEQAETIRELRAANARLTTETRMAMILAGDLAPFGPALKDAVAQLVTARDDLRSIEDRHGITPPSRNTPPVPPHDFAALWRSALADPQ